MSKLLTTNPSIIVHDTNTHTSVCGCLADDSCSFVLANAHHGDDILTVLHHSQCYWASEDRMWNNYVLIQLGETIAPPKQMKAKGVTRFFSLYSIWRNLLSFFRCRWSAHYFQSIIRSCIKWCSTGCLCSTSLAYQSLFSLLLILSSTTWGIARDVWNVTTETSISRAQHLWRHALMAQINGTMHAGCIISAGLYRAGGAAPATLAMAGPCF